MIELLKQLCELDGASGNEDAVRAFILSQIDGFCRWEVDALGNILAHKKGKNPAKHRIMVDAHMDEVGLIITHITPDGFLHFKTVGGIDTPVLLFHRVRFAGGFYGVIGGKPIHLTTGEEKKKLPKIEQLTIDIGAASAEEAAQKVSVGDVCVLTGETVQNGTVVKAKALDDRVGCAVLITLLKEESDFDFDASFSVQEEVGLRGARVAAHHLNPEFALVLEATTAADIAGVPPEKQVCRLGEGVAVSFMDGATVYDRVLYQAALESGLPVQPKRGTSGGNNSGAVHLSRDGVRTLALSVPCRYIHSASCVADVRDMEAQLCLARWMIRQIADGQLS
ncbi:MAG: M42 family peptidase [Clostridia bacterium]|nr:M42 family peptidase [Clostridia bacterium]